MKPAARVLIAVLALAAPAAAHAEETFGDRWASLARLPAAQARAGASLHRFGLGALEPEGPGAAEAYHALASLADRRFSAGTLELRFTLAAGSVYAGVEGSWGAARLDGGSGVGDDPEGPALAGMSYLYGAGVAGVILGTGATLVRAEALAGRRVVDLSFAAGDGAGTLHARDARWFVHERVSLERVLTPWVTAGLAFTGDLVELADWSVGLYVEGHLRAFDGRRTR